MLFEQPILAVAATSVVRSELLVRMVDEAGEIVPPGAFLPAAERFGQMPAIDRRVVEQALDAAARRARSRASTARSTSTSPGSRCPTATVIDEISP